MVNKPPTKIPLLFGFITGEGMTASQEISGSKRHYMEMLGFFENKNTREWAFYRLIEPLENEKMHHHFRSTPIQAPAGGYAIKANCRPVETLPPVSTSLFADPEEQL